MGQAFQTLCNGSSSISTQLKDTYINFLYGQDIKGKEYQHTEDINCKQFKDLKNILNQCTQKLKVSKCLYKDPSMPTDKVILKSISKQNNLSKQIQAVFLRPYTFMYNSESQNIYKIFLDDSNQDCILINDEVMQYLGVFLCFLANNPKIVEQLILTQPNTYGLHAVKMNIEGKPHIIYIDDYILCSQKRPVFSQPIKNMYLWPNILQKAWLKMTGFTQKIIQRSTPQQVFEAFLDHPYKKFSLQEIEEQQIRRYLQNYLYNQKKQYGYVLTTKKDPKIHIGISGRKYLYLIGSFVYDKRRLFYIRNPCGKFGFRGTYDVIDQQLKEKIRNTFNCFVQEGNFILEQSQFIEQISGFAICYYSNTVKNYIQDLPLENNSEILVLAQLKSMGRVSFCFRQQINKKTENKFSPVTYQVFNINTGELVSGQENQQGCFGLHNTYLFPQVVQKLPQSKYLIRLKKKDKKRHYFGINTTLIACSEQQVKFDIKNPLQYFQTFKECLKKQGKLTLQKINKQKNLSAKGASPIQHSVYLVGDLICVYIEFVSSRTQEYKIQISFPCLKNLQLIFPEINLKQTSVLPNTLGPSNRSQIIVFQKVDLTAETQLGQFQLEAF